MLPSAYEHGKPGCSFSYSISYASECFSPLQTPRVRRCRPERFIPLEPPDRSSPRATLNTFLSETNQAVASYKGGHRDEALAFLERASRCLNLEKEPPAIRHMMGFYTTLYLKETLDRIEIPPIEEIPDTKAVETEKMTSWTLPYTEITIAAVKDGPGGGGFLFTPDTVKKSEEFYNEVEKLPYKSGAEGALYATNWPPRRDRSFPRNSSIGCPSGASEKSTARLCGNGQDWRCTFDRPRRQCCSSIDLAAAALGISRRKTWFKPQTHVRRPHSTNHADPVCAAGSLVCRIRSALSGCRCLQGGSRCVLVDLLRWQRIWLIGAVLIEPRSNCDRSWQARTGGMHAQLTRFAFDVVTAVIVVGVAVNLGARLGLPTYSLVTGLGVGGLAVASGWDERHCRI